jgi:hypothetical protein
MRPETREGIGDLLLAIGLVVAVAVLTVQVVLLLHALAADNDCRASQRAGPVESRRAAEC